MCGRQSGRQLESTNDHLSLCLSAYSRTSWFALKLDLRLCVVSCLTREEEEEQRRASEQSATDTFIMTTIDRPHTHTHTQESSTLPKWFHRTGRACFHTEAECETERDRDEALKFKDSVSISTWTKGGGGRSLQRELKMVVKAKFSWSCSLRWEGTHSGSKHKQFLLLLIWFITSVNTFPKSSWSQPLVSSLLQYNMMFNE